MHTLQMTMLKLISICYIFFLSMRNAFLHFYFLMYVFKINSFINLFSPVSMSATTSYDLTSFRLLCPGVRLFLPVDGKQQRQGGDGLFSSRQVLHGHEALPRRHAAVADAAEVRLVWVLWAQDGLEGRKQALGGQPESKCLSVSDAAAG